MTMARSSSSSSSRSKKKKAGGGGASLAKRRSSGVSTSKHSKRSSPKTTPASLFGPVHVQQPKGGTWNLPASMGGISNNNKKKKTKKPKKSSSKGDPTPAKKPQTGFSVQMPVVSYSDPVVPWLEPSNQQHQPSFLPVHGEEDDPPTRKAGNRTTTAAVARKKIHSTLSIPMTSLNKFNAELVAFADYVRLSPGEFESRRSVIAQIQKVCRSQFGISPQSCRVFGSFASPLVCSFASDIDLAIHDVVPVLEQEIVIDSGNEDDVTPKRAGKRPRTIEKAEEDTLSVTKKAVATHPNAKLQERVLKWKALLEEAEEKRGETTSTVNASSTVPAKNTPSTGSPPKGDDGDNRSKQDEEPTSSASTTMASTTTRVELAESRLLPSTAEKSNDNGHPLFVIDRVGCPDPEEEKTMDAPTVTDTSKGSSIFDDEDLGEPPCPQEVASTNEEPSVNRGNDSEADNDDNKNINDDDSDADSADALAALETRQTSSTLGVAIPDQAELLQGDVYDDAEEEDDNDEEEEPALDTRPRSRSIISLCSATTADSADEKEWDDSGMEVSFVSSRASGVAAARKQATIGPTGETRAHVLRSLNTLAKKLRKLDFYTGNLHVRKNARVPIINMETRFGYECDIAIGGHSGADTSAFASAQCAKFQSFAIVVLFLKVLLNQQGLDKPFTGGLGSFKLYVLVASHIECHLELGGEDSPGEILLTFFFRYGNIPGHDGMENLRTRLSRERVLRTRGVGLAAGVAEMGGVSQLDNCISIFQRCYFVLRQKLKKPSTDPLHSILGYLVDAKTLSNERTKSWKKVVHLPSRSNASPKAAALSPGLPFNWSANALVQQNSTVRRSKRKADAKPAEWCDPLGTDDEEEELKAGYGLASASSAAKGAKAKGSPWKEGTNGKKKKKRKRRDS